MSIVVITIDLILVRSYQEEVKEFVGDSVSHVSHPTTKDAKTNTRESASSNTLTIPKIDNKINSANGKKTASSSQSSNNNHTSRSKTPIISPYQMKTDRDRSRTPVNNTPKDKVSSSKKSLIEGNPKTNLTAAKERKVSSFVTESTKIKTPTHQKNSSMITGEKKIETHYRTRSIISQPHPILIHDTISNNKEKKRRTDLSPVNIHSNKKNGIKLGFNTTTHHQMSKSQHLSESIKIEEPIKSTRIDNSEKIASSPSKEELNNGK